MNGERGIVPVTWAMLRAHTPLASHTYYARVYRVNEKQLTLDAAAYADEAGLWVGNKAKVVLDDFIGVHTGTGQQTQVLNIYRTDSGFIHAAPGRPL